MSANGRTREGLFAKGNKLATGRCKEYPEVKAAAREHTQEAIETLVTIMKDGKQPSAARVAAANALLDRGYGRPGQHVTGETTVNWKTVAVPEFDSWIEGLSSGDPNPARKAPRPN